MRISDWSSDVCSSDLAPPWDRIKLARISPVYPSIRIHRRFGPRHCGSISRYKYCGVPPCTRVPSAQIMNHNLVNEVANRWIRPLNLGHFKDIIISETHKNVPPETEAYVPWSEVTNQILEDTSPRHVIYL